jgi:Rrf2 family iron-sulfur cluster assembly transcriptional regulator
MVNLRINDLVSSQRGCKNGGYRLSKNPKDITLTQILNALDDNILCKNISTNDNDGGISSAIDRVVWQEVNQSILNFTDNITLYTIMEYVKSMKYVKS